MSPAARFALLLIAFWLIAYVGSLFFDELARRRRQRDMWVDAPPDPRCERPGSIESFYRERNSL